MLLLPLHGTLDFHDGIGVVVLVATLALWSLLARLRERMQRDGRAQIAPGAEDFGKS